MMYHRELSLLICYFQTNAHKLIFYRTVGTDTTQCAGSTTNVAPSFHFFQRLMWDANQRLRIVSPIVIKQQHQRSFMHDMQAELPMYLKSGTLVTWLGKWTSPELSMNLRIINLYVDLYAHGMLEEEDIILIYEFVQVMWQDSWEKIRAVYFFASKLM